MTEEGTTKFWAGLDKSRLGLLIGPVMQAAYLLLGPKGPEGFSDRAGGWLENWDKAAQEDILKVTKSVITGAGVPADMAEDLISLIAANAPDIPPFKSVHAVLMWITTNVGILKAPLEAIEETIKLATNAKFMLQRPDLISLLQYSWRFDDRIQIEQYAPELGISPDVVTILEEANRPIPNIAELQEFYRRSIYDWGQVDHSPGASPPPDSYYNMLFNDRFKTAAMQLGYTENDARVLFEQTYTLQPVQYLNELKRRNMITDEGWNWGMAKHGFNAESIMDQHKILTPLIGVGDIIQQFHRGFFDSKQQAVEKIRDHGFDEKQSGDLLDAGDNLLDPILLTVAYHRNFIDYNDYIYKLMYLGYTEDDAKLYEKSTWLLPAPSDLVRFGVREVYSPDIRAKFRMDEDFPKGMADEGAKIGYPIEVMKNYWAAHWDLPNPTQGFDMFHRGLIVYEELDMLLRALDVMPFWRDRLIQTSYRLIPRRALGKLVKQDILSETELYKHYSELGYKPNIALAFVKSALLSAAEPERELTKTDLLDAYRIGGISSRQLQTHLEDLGYDKLAIQYFMNKAERRRLQDIEKEQAEDEREEAREAKKLTKSEILRAYRTGLLDENNAKAYLRDLNFTYETAAHLISFEDLRKTIDDLETKAKYIKQLFDAGIISDHESRTKLIGAGWDSVEASRIINTWVYEKDTDNQLAMLRLRTPTRSDLNDWLIKGVIDPVQWAVDMGAMGYSDENIMRYLVELMIDRGE